MGLEERFIKWEERREERGERIEVWKRNEKTDRGKEQRRRPKLTSIDKKAV